VDPEPAVAVAYLTQLFEQPEPPLRWYSDSQIAQGLTYLVSTSATGDSGWLYSTDVPIADRVRCVEAVAAGSRRSQGKRRPASVAVIASDGLLPSLLPPTIWCGCPS